MKLAAALTLLLVPLPATAQAGAAPADRLVAAIEAAGCVVTANNNHAILLASGLTQAEGSAIVMALMSEGRAVPQGDDLRLVTGKCQ